MAVKTITTGRQKETKAEWLEYILFKAGRGGVIGKLHVC